MGNLSFDGFAERLCLTLRTSGKAEAERQAADVERNVGWDKRKLLAAAIVKADAGDPARVQPPA